MYTDPGFDGSTLAYFRLLEGPTATTYKNEVTGTNDLSNNAGTIIPGVPGPYGYLGGSAVPGGAVYVKGLDAGSRMVTAAGAFEAGTSALTLSAWVRLIDYGVGDNAWILMKAARPSWSSPFYIAALYLNSGVSLAFLVVLGGSTLATISVPLQFIPLNEWCLFAGTFDGANICLYVNGALVAGPVAASGTIVYSSGGNASPWVVGEPNGLSGNYSTFYIGSFWIDNVARSAAELLTRYQAGAKRY